MSFNVERHKFLDTQEQKDRLQQNVAIIKMEEGIILKEVLKLEHWLKIEFLLVFVAIMGIAGIIIWELLF